MISSTLNSELSLLKESIPEKTINKVDNIFGEISHVLHHAPSVQF